MTGTFSVIDENVLIVANGRKATVEPDCALRCIDYLLLTRESNGLVLDAGYLILAKYGHHCHHSGEPGVGDQFFIWARDNAAMLRKVELHDEPTRAFVEFPNDAALVTFDWDDRVFVAAAAAAGDAVVVNAVDSDYHHLAHALAQYVEIVELCPDELKHRSGHDGNIDN